MATALDRPVIWRPNPGPQTDFLSDSCDWVLYGGAAGGGKSDALLMDALGQVDDGAYQAILFRKSYPDLEELITRSKEIYTALGARWNKTEKTWTFPSGATIKFRYIERDDDARNYQGHQYQWVGFDELTHFTEWQWWYMRSRNRARRPGQKCYMRATCNPDGKGLHWVKAMFVDATTPGQVLTREIKDPVTGEVVKIRQRFIPARLSDNPILARTGYGAVLASLPEAERKALLEGDWDAYTGSVFKLEKGIHTWTWAQFKERTGEEAIPDGWHVFRCMDWGYAKPYAVYWIAVDYGGRMFVFREMYGVAKDAKGAVKANEGVRQEPELVARKIKAIDKDVRCDHGIADPACWAKGKGDYGGGPSIVEAMASHDVTWTAGKNDRIQGKMQLHQRLAHSKREWPMIVFIAEECPQAIRTIPALEYDEHHVEDVDSDGEDHAYDAIRYACMSRPLTPTKRTVEGDYQQRLREIKEDGWTV
jgi:hypothetical protein